MQLTTVRHGVTHVRKFGIEQYRALVIDAATGRILLDVTTWSECRASNLIHAWLLNHAAPKH